MSAGIEAKQNDSVFEFLNSSALESNQSIAECGSQSVKSSLEYSTWVDDLKTGKQVAISLGLTRNSISASDSEKNRILDNSNKESRPVSVISSATSRLSTLETRERDLLNRIAKFQDGIQRNEQRDKVCYEQ